MIFEINFKEIHTCSIEIEADSVEDAKAKFNDGDYDPNNVAELDAQVDEIISIKGVDDDQYSDEDIADFEDADEDDDEFEDPEDEGLLL